jgi:hypothetical protein
LIERHGEEASDIAAERVRVLAGCKDREVSRTWQLISRRIQEIAPARKGEDSFSWAERLGLAEAMSLGIVEDADDELEEADEAEPVA